MVRHRRFGVAHAGEAMHEGGRPERRLARKTEVGEGRTVSAERHAVGSRQLHEEVVRMLAIDQVCPAVGCLAGLEQERIPALALRRIERHHGAQPERARADGSVAHHHRHAFGEGLVVAARPGLLVVNDIDKAVRHDGPVALRHVQTRHRRGVGLPGSARAVAGHRVRPEGTLHLVRARRPLHGSHVVGRRRGHVMVVACHAWNGRGGGRCRCTRGSRGLRADGSGQADEDGKGRGIEGQVSHLSVFRVPGQRCR